MEESAPKGYWGVGQARERVKAHNCAQPTPVGMGARQEGERGSDKMVLGLNNEEKEVASLERKMERGISSWGSLPAMKGRKRSKILGLGLIMVYIWKLLGNGL